MSTYIYQMRCCQDIVDSKMGMLAYLQKGSNGQQWTHIQGQQIFRAWGQTVFDRRWWEGVKQSISFLAWEKMGRG